MDCATEYTKDFVLAELPLGARRVLEIGCGGGALAAALQAHGLEVVAIDSDPAAVEEARGRGVDARVAAWPDFADGAFDAVLFTRSLHHVDDLDASVAAAFAALRDGGRVIVEDFMAEGGSARSGAWFRSFAAMLEGADLLGDLTPYLELVLHGKAHDHDHDHDHQLHGSESIRTALRAKAAALETDHAAYYFRYLLPAIEDRDGFAAAILDHERGLITHGLIDPLGRRYVASRR